MKKNIEKDEYEEEYGKGGDVRHRKKEIREGERKDNVNKEDTKEEGEVKKEK